jgi:hypothetical protein
MLPDFDHDDLCPACGALVEGLGAVNGLERPTPGDPCICLYCTTINVMGDDGKLRLATHDEYVQMSLDPGVQAVIWAMHKLGTPPSRRIP